MNVKIGKWVEYLLAAYNKFVYPFNSIIIQLFCKFYTIKCVINGMTLT
jgi:hypothetical protein